MKTQIIQLEPHDDVISTRDKMGWDKAGRILLVWPDRGQVLNRPLDLVLLQRYSATLGAQLALVSTDPQVHQEAAALGLPVFKAAPGACSCLASAACSPPQPGVAQRPAQGGPQLRPAC